MFLHDGAQMTSHTLTTLTQFGSGGERTVN